MLPPPRPCLSGHLSRVAAVRLPGKPSSSLWDVSIKEGRISSIDQHDASNSRVHNEDAEAVRNGTLDGSNRLLAPSLCHAHVHLDKCFLLQDPKYSDLQIESGDFQEAMELTGKAKARFDQDDLLRRGRTLIEESISSGVTAMRAFVEVDGGVQFKCLLAGLKLKAEYRDRCDIQLCAFAQLPLFSGEDGGEEVRKLMNIAATMELIDVLGSTPYVEEDQTKQEANVHWISSLALASGKHLDLHLDYFLEEDTQPLIWTALDIVKGYDWIGNQGKRITLGHCTRLTRFNDEDWMALRQSIGNLPVSFVGLPTSDLFMMRTRENLRGTLPIVEMIQRHGLDAAIAINNVGNAFTPHGNCDPLSIASLGVGIYQAGTKQDTEVLYEAVSNRAKAAIGCESTSLGLAIGEPADFVLFNRMSDWRCRKSISEVVYDAGPIRATIRRGRWTGKAKQSIR
ncbi:cytosine deaminase protein-like protein [Karstenula rhodostoma CBS 690.94]|uniref:Cytosine deaminase protein-like protein n=1 Tax=Karstenula rhodostoma CBS 690.94 TaxID=1392251 RepID=A0A9P4UGG7_9PLEO|nr:cytosine deaminase protein-like protein [Karstenula rhodostoma CBS 690.94]